MSRSLDLYLEDIIEAMQAENIWFLTKKRKEPT